MTAQKLKIHIKTEKFSFPIPALRFSTLKWISKIMIRYCPHQMKENWLPSSDCHGTWNAIMKNITSKDITHIIEQLKQEEPFEMIDIETYDENEEKVIVKIYTI